MVPRQVLVLCDHDALYAAIDLKLGTQPQVQITRLKSEPPEYVTDKLRLEDFDLVIWATLSATFDPMSLLPRLPLANRKVIHPILVISECPSRPESEDGITFLNFPFDLDELNGTVMGILDTHERPAHD